MEVQRVNKRTKKIPVVVRFPARAQTGEEHNLPPVQ
jgi:hypothetical protein